MISLNLSENLTSKSDLVNLSLFILILDQSSKHMDLKSYQEYFWRITRAGQMNSKLIR